VVNAELKVLRALPLLAGLTDNLDGATREGANEPIRLTIADRLGDLDKSFHLFLPLVRVADEELLPDAAPDVRDVVRRHVRSVDRTARGGCPLDLTLGGDRLSADRDGDMRRGELHLIASSSLGPPAVANQNGGRWGTEEAFFRAIALLGDFAGHDDDSAIARCKAIGGVDVLVEVRADKGLEICARRGI
jgi:hypothetical protein